MTKGENTIPLREQLLEERLKNICGKIKHLEEKMVLMNAANEKALDLKSHEDKIHFEKLNGEYVRIDKIVLANVPRELHEQAMKELLGKIEALTLQSKDFVTKDYLAATLQTPSADIKNLTSHKDIQTGKNMVIGIVITFVLTVISIGISIFK